MARSRRKKKTPVVVIVLVVILAIILAGVYCADYFGLIRIPFLHKDDTPVTDDYVYTDGSLSIHFLELGNEYTGDCIYIKAGDNDILVDAGSRANSVPTITSYINNFVTDGILEYVIVTHADRDHIAGFAAKNSIFDAYECKTIIDFALTDKTTETYYDYVTNRDEEVSKGATHYTALQCYKQTDGAKRTYSLTEDITLNFLYHDYYETRHGDENNYSVCFMLKHGNRNFLFTGDLEEDGEKSLVQNNTLPQVELYKAGHHGSKTSSNDVLLDIIKPKIVCVCCCGSSVEYTQNAPNTFPTQAFINRVAKHTDKVYVTSYIDVVWNEQKQKYENSGEVKSLNGTIRVTSDSQSVNVNCTASNTILKDTEWFKNNRTCPSQWVA